MTRDEFFDRFQHGYVVCCKDIAERADVLQALLDNGYKINPNSLEYLKPLCADFNYPNPGLGNLGDEHSNYVVCWCAIPNKERSIEYDEFYEAFYGNSAELGLDLCCLLTS